MGPNFVNNINNIQILWIILQNNKIFTTQLLKHNYKQMEPSGQELPVLVLNWVYYTGIIKLQTILKYKNAGTSFIAHSNTQIFEASFFPSSVKYWISSWNNWNRYNWIILREFPKVNIIFIIKNAIDLMTMEKVVLTLELE